MRLVLNPHTTQTSPLGGEFQVTGVQLLRNSQGWPTGKEIVSIKYAEGGRVCLKCDNGKVLFKCCHDCYKKSDKFRCDECQEI